MTKKELDKCVLELLRNGYEPSSRVNYYRSFEKRLMSDSTLTVTISVNIYRNAPLFGPAFYDPVFIYTFYRNGEYHREFCYVPNDARIESAEKLGRKFYDIERKKHLQERK